MPDIDLMGIENDTQGICGFTSTLYAVHMNHPGLRAKLEGALLDATTRSTRLMAEIKTFLQMMRAAGKSDILKQITDLTRTFDGYGTWSVESYIANINNQTSSNYSIAMPPEATMEYMRTAWNLRPVLTDSVQPGDAILGLTRPGGPLNRWKNLAHYVYQAADGKIYSWGRQFTNLADLNAKGNSYSVVYRIMVHG
jgi:uncharacterized protein (DUF2147 family)